MSVPSFHPLDDPNPHNVPHTSLCRDCGGFRCRVGCPGYDPDDADPMDPYDADGNVRPEAQHLLTEVGA